MEDNSSMRIKSLDGWRGIAILLVLIDHVLLGALKNHYPYPWMQMGLHGVTLFFVLSGFLITTNLVSKPINLKKFYVRRFFRLMPVAWAFLALMVLACYCTGAHAVSWQGIRACLLFYFNLLGSQAKGNNFLIGHFWSLSIEEQFYLVWPWLLFLFGPRRCRWIAGIGASGVAIVRWYGWHYYSHGLAFQSTVVRADALLLGCLAALLLSERSVQERAAFFTRILAFPALAGLVLAIIRFHLLIPLWESACIAILLASTTLNPQSVLARILSWQPLTWLGVVSYSIYVWQQPFMEFESNLVGALLMLGVFLPLFALSSYYLLERPCTEFGRRLSNRLRPGPRLPRRKERIQESPVEETAS